MKYRLVVFDFDGTLADSEESIMYAMECVARDFVIAGVDRARVKQGIGLPLQQGLEMALGLDPVKVPAAVELYRQYYNDVAFDKTRLFPGVKKSLERLVRNGVLLAVASSKSTHGLEAMMRFLGLFDFFSFVAGAQDVERPKPAPDMVKLALKVLDVRPQDCLVVGDTVFDIEMGQRASADTCAVTYGHHSVDELRSFNPTFMIDSFAHIVSIADDGDGHCLLAQGSQ
ncbi:HAD-superfamily hydrolase, subfamily IA, variant 1 [Prosthecochloris aestuarii DSM 271]|uniref:phosphoglycolate phosphatase n=1 Tax=Prosthecochloris aestuarii (strain DSM 271 / SK 413) TaxID=290512 RepID=B4S776_PROA2|nr:HAD family hydrolase [Prosthecochloris aestuarii]ACF45913.1 HAD-superfamily hydrolase, subfamily IA, variant 1 [Prosthecochloris aestuarii DSM 271]